MHASHCHQLHKEAKMGRLAILVYSVVGMSLAGVGVVVVLAANMGTAQNIIIAAVVGLVLALPLTWYVTKQIY
jgi:hypothetical protein